MHIWKDGQRDQPDLVPVYNSKGKRRYRLRTGWIYEWVGPDGRRYRFVVFAGAVTDGLSVPRWAWTITGILPDGLGRAAGLLHDLLYRSKGRTGLCYDLVMERYNAGIGKWVQDTRRWDREGTDTLFCRVLREAGEPRRKRRLMWRAVRVGGKKHWGGPIPA